MYFPISKSYGFASPVPVPMGTPYFPISYQQTVYIESKEDIERHLNAVMFSMYFTLRELRMIDYVFNKSFSKKERDHYPDVIELKSNIDKSLSILNDVYDDLMYQCDGDEGQKMVSSTLSCAFDIAKELIDGMRSSFRAAVFGDSNNKRADITSRVFFAGASSYMSVLFIQKTVEKFSAHHKYLSEKIYKKEILEAEDYINKIELFFLPDASFKYKEHQGAMQKYQKDLLHLLADNTFYPKIATSLGYAD